MGLYSNVNRPFILIYYNPTGSNYLKMKDKKLKQQSKIIFYS